MTRPPSAARPNLVPRLTIATVVAASLFLWHLDGGREKPARSSVCEASRVPSISPVARVRRQPLPDGGESARSAAVAADEWVDAETPLWRHWGNQFISGVDLERLDEDYAPLLARAQAGDAAAMRTLARLDGYCMSGDEPLDDEFFVAWLEGGLDTSLFDQESVRKGRQFAEACYVVRHQGSGEDWKQRAIDAGDPIAPFLTQSPIHIFRPEHYDDQVRHDLLEAARNGDSWFMLTVYLVVGGGYDASRPGADQISTGWFLLMCRLNPYCDRRVMRAKLEREQFLYELDAAEREADALWAMFEDGSIHEHDFQTAAWRP